MSRRIALALSLALVGCASHAAKPAPAPAAAAPPPIDADGAARLADALVGVLTSMADIAHAADCQVMGTQLGVLFDRSQPLFDRLRQFDEDPQGARLVKSAMDARAGEVGPLIDAMGPGLVRCRADASVIAAMDRMPTL